jgi:DnaJ-class molecular chaperone
MNTAATIKKAYRKLCRPFHPDEQEVPITSQELQELQKTSELEQEPQQGLGPSSCNQQRKPEQ